MIYGHKWITDINRFILYLYAVSIWSTVVDKRIIAGVSVGVHFGKILIYDFSIEFAAIWCMLYLYEHTHSDHLLWIYCIVFGIQSPLFYFDGILAFMAWITLQFYESVCHFSVGPIKLFPSLMHPNIPRPIWIKRPHTLNPNELLKNTTNRAYLNFCICLHRIM